MDVLSSSINGFEITYRLHEEILLIEALCETTGDQYFRSLSDTDIIQLDDLLGGTKNLLDLMKKAMDNNPSESKLEIEKKQELITIILQYKVLIGNNEIKRETKIALEKRSMNIKEKYHAVLNRLLPSEKLSKNEIRLKSLCSLLFEHAETIEKQVASRDSEINKKVKAQSEEVDKVKEVLHEEIVKVRSEIEEGKKQAEKINREFVEEHYREESKKSFDKMEEKLKEAESKLTELDKRVNANVREPKDAEASKTIAGEIDYIKLSLELKVKRLKEEIAAVRSEIEVDRKKAREVAEEGHGSDSQSLDSLRESLKGIESRLEKAEQALETIQGQTKGFDPFQQKLLNGIEERLEQKLKKLEDKQADTAKSVFLNVYVIVFGSIILFALLRYFKI